MPNYKINYSKDHLEHHGILGQKWGERNGPPYPLGGGDYSRTERAHLYKWKKSRHNIYNKKHHDSTLQAGKKLATLSYDQNRTKGTDMFYAAYSRHDKQQYNALFNNKIPQDIYDDNGNKIGTGMFYKYRINNKIGSDIKVASEDSGAKAFMSLFEKDRDFYNFIIDSSRMQSHFVEDKYKFKGYREARSALEEIRSSGKITDEDLKTIYRMFNYVIPSDGGGDPKRAKDIATQRAKFFKELSKDGYGAVLDTNDAIYGGFKAESPVIIFDQSNIVSTEAMRVSTKSKYFDTLMFIGRRSLGR